MTCKSGISGRTFVLAIHVGLTMVETALTALARACCSELERAADVCAPAGVEDFDNSECRVAYGTVEGKRVRVGPPGKRPTELSTEEYNALKAANFSCKTTKCSVSNDHKILMSHLVIEVLAAVKPFEKYKENTERFGQAAKIVNEILVHYKFLAGGRKPVCKAESVERAFQFFKMQPQWARSMQGDGEAAEGAVGEGVSADATSTRDKHGSDARAARLLADLCGAEEAGAHLARPEAAQSARAAVRARFDAIAVAAGAGAATATVAGAGPGLATPVPAAGAAAAFNARHCTGAGAGAGAGADAGQSPLKRTPRLIMAEAEATNARAAELSARNAELALRNDAARQKAMADLMLQGAQAQQQSVRMFGDVVAQLTAKDTAQKAKASLALLKEMLADGDIDRDEFALRKGRILDKLEG